MTEYQEVLRIFYILNAYNNSALCDRERTYRNAHRPGFQRPAFDWYYEIFEEISEMKSKIRNGLFQNSQKQLIDLVYSEKGYTVGPAFPTRINVWKYNTLEQAIELNSVDGIN